ncbi:MAG: hypothetical protein DHS20C11_09340 [Lysobacteraceae bacterium]|nr:MAG: hypothetical protein DHS20C11_09340 [Xanthomonadaceae bacterium]
MSRWAAQLCWSILGTYVAIAVGVWCGLWGQNYDLAGGPKWGGISSDYWLGTNLIGQDIFARSLTSVATALQTGLMVGGLATMAGALAGACAGYWRGRWPDRILLWLMGVIDAIPFVLLAAAIAYALGAQFIAVALAMILTLWVPVARLVRAETQKLRTMPYVESAQIIGVSPVLIILRHILPNTWHLLMAQGLLVMVAALKAEVVLSFLGIGSQASVSWGVMIAESTQEVASGRFNNFLAASIPLFGLVFVLGSLADFFQSRRAGDSRASGPMQA